MSSLINIWNEACMNWFRSYYLHSVFIFPCFWYLFMECILIPFSARGSKELQRIYLQWWMGYMLPYESCRQESVFSERGSWDYREIWRAWKARLLERVDCEKQAGNLRRTENSLRVGDKWQERRNSAVSLLISAGRIIIGWDSWAIVVQMSFCLLSPSLARLAMKILPRNGFLSWGVMHLVFQ